jgi:hypothetical protein
VAAAQNRCHHVGNFPELEDQMTGFVPDLDRGKAGSPDRCDALVWAMHELLVEREPYAGLFQWYQGEAARLRMTVGAHRERSCDGELSG